MKQKGSDMAIGKHECKLAQGTDLIGAIRIGIDETLTALEEAIHDLTDEQAQTFPIEGRNNIVWIVMHCLQNLHEYAVDCGSYHIEAAEHQKVWDDEDRWDLWQAPPERRPRPGDKFPTVAAMMDHLEHLRDMATVTLKAATNEDMTRPAGKWRPTVADAYMRTICHTNSHVRQIWALRGIMGAVDGDKAWPRQHWA